ncbi:hypothetical protein NIES2135_60340 (plasmid) [Leptolyngbya boryana NIES-2135]|uniref:Uncharacterized protein n=1 Tax=Leptolyngbya boryana NIES-2135 TaxID=1973484 RepID=A0A1Z4JR63_LEPBY|nr:MULTISPECIES: hypothetical protein [Leptolyngbya]BAY59157.1 hypothetical protein NIES2135_60340 [Leptolyngbya boryana NIES-2135]MBD2372748.1 hypothetical protein [Leptolyngbya sp. FACHB-238]MBD2402193.1 hypothetical protein [Leptolyngbya sp. FACHB-239]MBD2403696.1 hypothetical protein [Leptolyngbya sp. FACHB-402]ULP33356.1 hypothetical protein MCP04_29925 [Leptolyngbya boryana IU 594]
MLSLKGTTGKDCQATYGNQNVTCTRVQASALDTVYIDDLQLDTNQKKVLQVGGDSKINSQSSISRG